MTPQERAELDRKMTPKVRNLVSMLINELEDDQIQRAVKQFRFWLMGINHHYRMAGDPDAQDTVGRIIELLNQNQEGEI